TLEDYIALCDFVVEANLVDHTDPIQLAIRLLIPPRSALLRCDRPRPWLGPLVAEEFGYRWDHPDARMDALHSAVSAVVERAAHAGGSAAPPFARLRSLASRVSARELPPAAARPRRFVPKLSEPWFCCAEPNARQLDSVSGSGREASRSCCDE